jgi:hypothetical protein
MEFVFLINTDPAHMPTDPSSPEAQESFAAWMAFNQKLIEGGHWVSGASLQGPDTATLVRKKPGTATVVSDGPFAETKEQIGGFYIVRAADLDEAIALADAMPAPAAAIEVRPLMFRPDS